LSASSLPLQDDMDDLAYKTRIPDSDALSAPPTRYAVQFREGASNWVDTPFLQATTFEHEHEHEHEQERRTPNAEREAPCEGMSY
jgi:hypothetical protein